MRILLYLLAAYQGANGLFMLTAPELWYQMTPGASHTGPANTHFIRDIGLAFLAAATALVLAARKRHPGVPVIVATVFLGGHAALHAVELILHSAPLGIVARDTGLIILPAFLPLLVLRQHHALTEG